MKQDNNSITVSAEDFLSGKADHLIAQLPQISDKEMIDVLLARVKYIEEYLGLTMVAVSDDPVNPDPTVGDNK